jgi:hypothetical protein
MEFDPLISRCYDFSAGWSSLVARWAHNPKVGGSNPPPATTYEFLGTYWLPFVAVGHAAVTQPQVSNGNTLRTITLFAARLPSDIAWV